MAIFDDLVEQYHPMTDDARESAQPYYDEVKAKQNTYVQPGEVPTALAIMAAISNNATS